MKVKSKADYQEKMRRRELKQKLRNQKRQKRNRQYRWKGEN